MSAAPDVSWTPPSGGLFSLRVGAILVRAGRVLLTRTDGQDHWFLPGGRAKLGEPAAEALRRELREELGLTPGEVRVRVIAENFFTVPGRGAVHEVGFYGECAADGLPDGSEFVGSEFVGAEGPGSVFRWVSAAELADLDVRPRPVADLLFALPEHPVHLQIGP
ncbi:NUDIX hydrolase [Actinomycetospora sp. TBRC 11914]|uniref:NUDIX hydrolase n=1 Tax=Actinomycetospora sp. TBRC 11914 TaxID=2729387 RepID=UPI00145DE650|nr:NUDIX domain-containing protein [Actinomycetospora sp. TBRC 11914]NMO93487.1 NUDIX domain-containing protein [Actinomycetospora sp. TBRC 11914]